jgi:hypothetical protein
MLKRIGSSLVIGGFFAIVLYTTNGCGGAGITNPDLHFASLAGLVTDAATGSPVANASVSERQRDSVTTVTTTDGRYFISAIDVGSVRVDVTKTGYQPFSTSTSVKEGPNTLDVRLQPGSP